MPTPRRSSVLFVSAIVASTLVVPVTPSLATETAPPETVFATMEDLPEASASRSDGDDRNYTDIVAAEVPFSMIGLKLPPGIDEAELRTRDLDGSWNAWAEFERLGDDSPDRATDEGRATDVSATEPLWVAQANAFQVRLEGDVTEVQADLIDTEGLSESVLARTVRRLTPRVVPATAEAASRPNVISRTAWGANESLRKRSPSYATPKFGVVHHTAGSNNYTKSQSASIVRGIYSYHTQSLGWNDIGYNFLVDKYGQTFEGRYGGMDKGVVGAHASGFNSGSIGVSVLGNYDLTDVSAATMESVAQVLAWKYDIHGIDASATRTITVHGRQLNVTTAHRNVGSTSCPGKYLYGRLGQLRARIAALATGSPTPTEPAFDDVPRSHSQYGSIEYIAARKITTGCTADRFCPNNAVTREQMASFLTRALGLELPWWTPFQDVDGGTHARAIAATWREGITNGCTPDRFCPGRDVTREQMASFVARAFDVPNRQAGFPDVVDGSTHADAIGGLAEAGIVNGYSDATYRPKRPVSRSDMAAFLHRALVWKASN